MAAAFEIVDGWSDSVGIFLEAPCLYWLLFSPRLGPVKKAFYGSAAALGSPDEVMGSPADSC
jgi:hypothetical protein